MRPKKGDRIVMIHPYMNFFTKVPGVAVKESTDYFAVDFDDPKEVKKDNFGAILHSAQGLGREGHCWWIPKGCLRKEMTQMELFEGGEE